MMTIPMHQMLLQMVHLLMKKRAASPSESAVLVQIADFLGLIDLSDKKQL
jgi:hypothetical protein